MNLHGILPLVAGVTLGVASMGFADSDPSPAQLSMLEAIRESVQDSVSYTGRGTLSDRVMAAMAAVPREAYVPDHLRHLAYRNTPLAIEAGQTISQPLIVALMTDLLDPQPTDRVLEVGTGSGYQAAVLAELVAHVYSIEIIPELASSAARTLAEQGVSNATARQGDGYQGWPEHAPFDGIIVTAAPEDIPAPLLQQLKPGGRLVIPVGPQHGAQNLLLLEMGEDGEISRESVLPVRFVPLTGDR